jgi:hypothetical protein
VLLLPTLCVALATPSFIRYDISRIKMKANDVLTNSETATDEAIALGIDISKTGNYEEGQLIVSRLNAFIINRSGGFSDEVMTQVKG